VIGQRRRLTLFRNIWPPASMDVYVNNLRRCLQDCVGDHWKITECAPAPTYLLNPFQPVLRRIPFLNSYANDWFLSRYVKYPLRARFSQGDINHLCDDSMGHLGNFLDRRKTIITCFDLRPLKLCLRESGALKLHRFSLKGLRKAARVITVSEASKRDLLQLTDCEARRIHVIPLGVTDCYKPLHEPDSLEMTRQKYGLDDRIWLLHVGLSWEHKNIEGILRALRILLQQGRNVSLLKAGEALSPHQRALAGSLEVNDHIHSLGHVSDRDLVAIYNIADVLLMPSFNEGFGLPILEAMACGTPVVTSNVSSMPEVAGQAAVLVDPHKPEEIANAIGAVLTHEHLRARLRNAGFKRAGEFTWERTAQKTLVVYEAVLREVSGS